MNKRRWILISAVGVFVIALVALSWVAGVNPLAARSTPTPTATRVIVEETVTDTVTIYAEPSFDSDPMGTVEVTGNFDITGRHIDSYWWRIDYEGEHGWVYSELLRGNQKLIDAIHPVAGPIESFTVNFVRRNGTDYWNVYSGPSVNSSIIGRVEAGESFDLIGKSNSSGWYVIDWNRRFAWLHLVTGDDDLRSLLQGLPSVTEPEPTIMPRN